MEHGKHQLTQAKARTMLHEGMVRGHDITGKQRKFFGAVAGGQKPYSQMAKKLRKK